MYNKPFRRPFFFLRFLPFVFLFIVAGGFVTMGLWNWLVPVLFHGPILSFGQAIGLLLLSKILFGGFRRPWGGGRWGGKHGGGPMMWRQKMQERMASMTPDERAAFMTKVRNRCGGRFDGFFDEQPKEAPKEAPQA